eukprot:2885881-Prymnesium_polylepis.1
MQLARAHAEAAEDAEEGAVGEAQASHAVRPGGFGHVERVAVDRNARGRDEPVDCAHGPRVGVKQLQAL